MDGEDDIRLILFIALAVSLAIGIARLFYLSNQQDEWPIDLTTSGMTAGLHRVPNKRPHRDVIDTDPEPEVPEPVEVVGQEQEETPEEDQELPGEVHEPEPPEEEWQQVWLSEEEWEEAGLPPVTLGTSGIFNETELDYLRSIDIKLGMFVSLVSFFIAAWVVRLIWRVVSPLFRF